MIDELELKKMGQVELAELCSELWDKYFAEPAGSSSRTQLAVDYTLAACQYNKNAGARMMSAITPSTVNVIIEDEDDTVAAKPLKNAEVKVLKKLEPKEPKEVKEKILKISGDYKSTNEPMPLTDEIKAILEGDGSGADKIRAVYFLNPDGFNVEDFVKYSGINRGRTVGCLKKISDND